MRNIIYLELLIIMPFAIATQLVIYSLLSTRYVPPNSTASQPRRFEGIKINKARLRRPV